MTNEKYLKQLDGLDVKYYDVKSAVEDIKAGSFAKLNYTSRVLAENLLRKCPSADLKDSLNQLIEKRTDKDFPWYPSRVICHDILGLTGLTFCGSPPSLATASLRPAKSTKAGSFAKLNYTSRVLAENLLRKCPSADLKDSLIQLIEKRTPEQQRKAEIQELKTKDFGAYIKAKREFENEQKTASKKFGRNR
jgi:aconitase A